MGWFSEAVGKVALNLTLQDCHQNLTMRVHSQEWNKLLKMPAPKIWLKLHNYEKTELQAKYRKIAIKKDDERYNN